MRYIRSCVKGDWYVVDAYLKMGAIFIISFILKFEVGKLL